MISWFRENISRFSFRLSKVYLIAGISRQYYFKTRAKQEQAIMFYRQLKEAVMDLREDHPKLGARPLHKLLKLQGVVGINRFETWLQEEGFGIKIKRSLTITTDSKHGRLTYKNLINGIKLTGINQVWSSDITYFLIAEQVFYIIFIEDVYSRRILGYAANDNMFADNNVKALLSSIKQRGCDNITELIHHSDKGSQYCSKAYVSILKKHKIKISMAETSLENAYVERLNGIIKNYYLYPRKKVYDLKSLQIELKTVVGLYNTVRPHSELGMISPVQFENQLNNMDESRRKVMTLYDFTKTK